jgi:hypothetical protein
MAWVYGMECTGNTRTMHSSKATSEDESGMRVSTQEYFIGLTAIDTAKATESSITLIDIQFVRHKQGIYDRCGITRV